MPNSCQVPEQPALLLELKEVFPPPVFPGASQAGGGIGAGNQHRGHDLSDCEADMLT